MKDCIILGMALGFIAGAIFVQGNKNAQAIVEQGKTAIEEKFSELKECMTKNQNNQSKVSS